MPAHLLANTVYALLLIDATPRRALAAGVLGSMSLTLHNPVPHLLFALPWIASMMWRPGERHLIGSLVIGYLPGCLVLGVGWFLFCNALVHGGGGGSVWAAPSARP